MAADKRVFRNRETGKAGWLFLILGPFLLLVGVSCLATPDGLSPVAALLLIFAGPLVAALGIVFLHGAGVARVEVSDDALTIVDMLNRVRLAVPWSQIDGYRRKQFLGNNEPYWEVSVGSGRYRIPYLVGHAGFQQEMFQRIPAAAIPPEYRDHGRRLPISFQLPIKQFSLVADEHGVSVDSAVNHANIAWIDVLYIEEFDYATDAEGGEPDVPRIHICSKTDDFTLTRTWDRYDDIRRLVFLRAPENAVVIRADKGPRSYSKDDLFRKRPVVSWRSR